MEHILFEESVEARLMAFDEITSGKEFSGVGFIEIERTNNNKKFIRVYDFVLMNIGDFAYTEYSPEAIMELVESRDDSHKGLCWIHKHPMGTGFPGPRNWSKTDEDNIRLTPLGAHPSFLKFSCSAVLTPYGWVGRVDTYKDGKHSNTKHLNVVCPILNACAKEKFEIMEKYPLANHDTRPVAKYVYQPASSYSYTTKASNPNGNAKDWKENLFGYMKALPGFGSFLPEKRTDVVEPEEDEEELLVPGYIEDAIYALEDDEDSLYYFILCSSSGEATAMYDNVHWVIDNNMGHNDELVQKILDFLGSDITNLTTDEILEAHSYAILRCVTLSSWLSLAKEITDYQKSMNLVEYEDEIRID